MIDITSVKYDFVVITPQGAQVHLFEVRKALSWEEQAGELAQKLNAEFKNTMYQGQWLHKYFALNTPVFLFSDWGEGWKEVFRGTVWGRSNPDQYGSFKLTAYDMLKYTKSKDDRYYSSGTIGKTIITDIANDWKIPLGQIDGPNIALAKKAFRNNQISDMFMEVLDDAKYKGDGVYVIRAKQGKMDVVRRGQNSPVFHFGMEDMTGLLDDSEDMEDLITRAKIIGSQTGDKKAPVYSTIDGKTKYGIIQDIVIKEQSEKPVEAQEAAKKLLDEKGKPNRKINVPAPDLPFLRKGDKIHITAGALNGYFYIKGIRHDADEQQMTMEVEAA